MWSWGKNGFQIWAWKIKWVSNMVMEEKMGSKYGHGRKNGIQIWSWEKNGFQIWSWKKNVVSNRVAEEKRVSHATQNYGFAKCCAKIRNMFKEWQTSKPNLVTK